MGKCTSRHLFSYGGLLQFFESDRVNGRPLSYTQFEKKNVGNVTKKW